MAELLPGEPDDHLVEDQDRAKIWALPCCGRVWKHSDGRSKRCFSILQKDGKGVNDCTIGFI
eukprot:3908672-Lingulodinium_polyedra.AAC.1